MAEFRDFLTEATYMVFGRLPTLLPNGSHTQYWGPDLADDVAIVLYMSSRTIQEGRSFSKYRHAHLGLACSNDLQR